MLRLDIPEIQPRYNIAPTQPVLSVRQLSQHASRWEWADDAKTRQCTRETAADFPGCAYNLAFPRKNRFDPVNRVVTRNI